MGKSNAILEPFYFRNIKPEGKVALLGFTNNDWFKGKCYDLSLGNWNINDDWDLGETYDYIICLRCFCFCKDPEKFIKKCHEHLNPGGVLVWDANYGDHYRFSDYKVGWKNEKEHEFAYQDDNYLYASLYDSSFMGEYAFMNFKKDVEKKGYNDIEKAIYEEVPSLLQLSYVDKFFKNKIEMLNLWPNEPQLYILIISNKKELEK
jgi:SAM-dependent methyltransferase